MPLSLADSWLSLAIYCIALPRRLAIITLPMPLAIFISFHFIFSLIHY